jgi:RNA polymerase sigma-70 factor (ECF subfamily)
MYQRYDDTELFQLIAGGDVEAYRQIFSKYFPKVFEAALAYTKVPEQAEDIVQGVFLKLWEKREQLSIIKSPKDWLFIVARNDIMSGFKKQASQQNYLNHLKEVFREEEGTPEEMLILRQKDEVLKQAVERLSNKQREAYQLSREEGLSYAEIAERMQISKNTVREHIANSLKSIRNFLFIHKDELVTLIVAVSLISGH